MGAKKITDFVAQTIDGDTPWAAWANTAAAEIVVQRSIGRDCVPGDWVLAHRRSGRHLSGRTFRFKTMAAALKAAAKVEPIWDWSEFSRPRDFDSAVDELTDDQFEKLRNKVTAVLSKAGGRVK